MEWTRVVGVVCVLGVVLAAVGALVSLASNDLMTGPVGLPAVLVLGLVVGSVIVVVLVGRRSQAWTSNPDSYW